MLSKNAGPSIVRSIRQRQLLNAWLRLFAKGGGLPDVDSYHVDRLEDEKPDMMYYAVTYDGTQPRYIITYDGQRLIDAYGVSGKGRFLEDVIGPERAAITMPIYDECVAHHRPSYTICRVIDVDGREVDYERLLLPFGNHRGVIDNIIASFKTISVDGGFVQKDLMRTGVVPPRYTVHAIIDQGTGGKRPRMEPADEVVEI
jgi:hypothetical protein